VPAAELGDRLTMSVGAVSMSLAELQKWGIVRRTWRPGDRRDFYEAEVSIWKMVSRVFRERELQMVRSAEEDFAAAEKAIGLALKRATGERKRALKFTLDRIGQLLVLTRMGEALLGALLSGGSVDATPIRSFLLGGGKGS
jgi:DNA-binding transcriptional regulator GbsR (MarR family)